MKLIGILAFLAVAWLSLATEPLPGDGVRKMIRPFEHVVMFAVFAFVSFWAWRGKGGPVLIILLVIAGLMEATQILLSARAFELEDLAANVIGVAIGCGLFWSIQWIWVRWRRQS